MTGYCCSLSLCNCEAAPPSLSLNLSTPLSIRWELGLMGARLDGSKMAATRSGDFLRYLELECSLPMSILMVLVLLMRAM